MLNRIRISLKQPGLVINFIKDKFRHILLYLLIMGFLMVLPSVITAVKEPTKLFPSQTALQEGIKNRFNDQGLSITNNTLNNPNNINASFLIREYNVVIGDLSHSINGVVIHFTEDSIDIYMNALLNRIDISTHTYDEVYIQDIEFNTNDNRIIAASIRNVLSESNMLKSSLVIYEMLFYMLEYLFIALLFTLMFRISNRLPISFGHSFKMSFYITTMYAITTLILNLFGVPELAFIAFLAVYINHIRAYRKIRIVRRIGVKEENDKKEE